MKVSANSSGKNPVTKFWAKQLTGVDQSKSNGFAFSGDWIEKTDSQTIESKISGPVLIAIERGSKKIYALIVPVGFALQGDPEPAGNLSWFGSVEGATVAKSSDGFLPIIRTAIEIGVPAVATNAPERRPRFGATCGYTGRSWSGRGLCPHCGDEC